MKSFMTGLADLIFPPACCSCGALLGRGMTTFCGACLSEIRFIRAPLCPVCGIPYPNEEEINHRCADCIRSKESFSLARAVGVYDAVLLEVIHRFKYRGRINLGEVLGRFMAEFRYEDLRIEDYSLIVPVPLHRRRLKERGFNQAVVLAREISRRHAVPMDFGVLKRKIYTEPQTGLGRDDRLRNIRGAFEVVRPEAVKEKKVLLIDDVYTTGSTVRECARVLGKCGASEVAALTLARAV